MRDRKSYLQDVPEDDECGAADGWASEEVGAAKGVGAPLGAEASEAIRASHGVRVFDADRVSYSDGSSDGDGVSNGNGVSNGKGVSKGNGSSDGDGVSDGNGACNGVIEAQPKSETFTTVNLEDVPQEPAAVSGGDGTLDGIFDAAQTARQEIQLIRLDVIKLRDINARTLSEVCDAPALRRDANAVATEIKSRGEAVLTRLKKMDARVRELEAQLGANAAATRVARTQYLCLGNAFRDVMFDYNEAEVSHRQICKCRLQRQLEIVGREVTEEEIDAMIESGEWNVFGGDVLAEGKTSRAALDMIEGRHQELLDLETRLRGLHELFLDVALLVEEHGPILNAIQTNTDGTEVTLQECMAKLETAKRYDKANPFKRMFCGCFPCYN